MSDHGYAGYRFDPLTGLYSAGDQREYGPGTATWYSEDPEGLRPDANLYRSVGNSVTTATDPSGRKVWITEQDRAEWEGPQ